MPNVWYIGPYDSRSISSSEWARSGISGVSTTVWNKKNGHTVDQATLTTSQINLLANQSEFLINQTGYRNVPIPDFEAPTQPNPGSGGGSGGETGPVYWNSIQGKPEVIAAGANKSDARSAIDAPAINEVQPVDATLTALAALSTAADQIIISNGNDVFALIAFTELARAFVASADQAAARNAIGAGTYSLPQNGIPSNHLSVAVQDLLTKANTALQALPNHSHLASQITETTELKVMTAAERLKVAGIVPPPVYVPGGYYFCNSPFSPSSSNALGFGSLRLSRWDIFSPLSINTLFAEHTVAQASTTLRLGIYADNGFGRPGALIVDAGSIDTSAAAGVTELTIANLSFPVSSVWVGGVVQGSGSHPTIRNVNSSGVGVPFASSVGTTKPAALASMISFSALGINGALPSTFPESGGASIGLPPRVGFRVAA